MKPTRTQHGYVLLSLLFITMLLPALLYATGQLLFSVNTTGTLLKGVSGKQRMASVKALLLDQGRDVDGDGKFELLKEGSGQSVPSALPVLAVDEWDRPLKYLSWDPLPLNTADTTFSQNAVVPPVSGLVGRLASAGADGEWQTTLASATSASGDDILLEIFESESGLANGATTGWKRDLTEVSGWGNIRTIHEPDRVYAGGLTLDTSTVANGSPIINLLTQSTGATTMMGRLYQSYTGPLILESLYTPSGNPGGEVRLGGGKASAMADTLDLRGTAVYLRGTTYVLPSPADGTGGNLSVSGSVTANSFLYSSDARLKEQVTPIPSALARLKKLQGVNFAWKATGQKSLGFIAQRVETIFPELVATDPTTGLKAVHYGNLTAVLTEALKEMEAQKNAEIAALQQSVEALEARVSALEQAVQKGR